MTADPGVPGEPLTVGIAANVRRETGHGPGGRDVQRGTRHFAPGAKVWLLPQAWGMPDEQYPVVGRHRGSARYIKIVMQIRHLQNFRVRGVYSPALYAAMTRPLVEGSTARLWSDPDWAARFAAAYNQE